GEPLEIGQRDDRRGPIVEADAPGFQVGPGAEPAQPGETLPAAFPAGPWPVDDPDVHRVELEGCDRVGTEEQAGRIGGDADLATGVGTQQVEGGLGDRPAEVAVEDEDGKRSSSVEARPMARLG